VERLDPSCPASSEVGSVGVRLGVGPTPLAVRGDVYLAGPYEGAPFSVAVVIPALAGPFDLGVVVDRVRLEVDPRSARVHAVADPLPEFLHGIPLDLRSLDLRLDRPGFSLNPTSCEPTTIAAGLNPGAGAGSGSPLASPFQVGGCAALPFKPALSVRFGGATGRNGHPAVTALVRPRSGDANIARAALLLPRGVLIDQGHIGGVCTRAEFTAGRCPADSAYGRIEARTPLLDGPLRGALYLREGPHRLPDLVAALRGQVKVVLVGRLATPHARVKVSFDRLPDVPLGRLALTLRGGRRGLLVDSEDACSGHLRTDARLAGHNGKLLRSRLRVTAACGAGRGGKAALR
jgi:hypothetical protein